MSYPKFAVGEDVLIVSEDYPEVQGFETAVAGVTFNEAPINHETGEEMPAEYGYQVSPDPHGDKFYWGESALRKRPSDFTFNELMDSLKTPVPVGG